MAIEFLESTFCKHSNDFTLNMIPNWKASQQPKLLSVKARPSAKLRIFLCNFWCSTFVFLVQLLVRFLVLYFRFSRATSGAPSRALLSVFSCNFWCPFSCSTFGFLVQLLVPFLVLYFRFSRATSGAPSRALLSVFSCNFWCPFSCSTFGFLVQLLVLYFRFSRATSRALSRAISFAPRSFSCAIWPYTSFDYL